KNEMKIGVVIMPRRSAARLEFLDRLPDGAADAAAVRFRKAKVAIFQKRAQTLARPGGAIEPRQDDPGPGLRHGFLLPGSGLRMRTILQLQTGPILAPLTPRQRSGSAGLIGLCSDARAQAGPRRKAPVPIPGRRGPPPTAMARLPSPERQSRRRFPRWQ